MHWTLAEAINTSSVLYHVTKKEKYADDYADFMAYLDDKVIDHVNGSWFHQLDENNHVIGTVWPGKNLVESGAFLCYNLTYKKKFLRGWVTGAEYQNRNSLPAVTVRDPLRRLIW